MEKTTTFCHKTIGRIHGVSKTPGVDQYLGIQYATLQDRFSRGEILYSYPDGELDATKLGPIPWVQDDACEMEQRVILQQSLPFAPLTHSDTRCLTLNITRPNIWGPNILPVLVFVHGGAFVTGSSSFPQYDLARIVNTSIEACQPIVAVSINYRLGVPGFLHSVAMREAGYKSNNGIDDQKVALRWIRHHISGFGGNPNRVTFMGESAGGASGCFHLFSAENLYSQFISMSGSPLAPPVTLDQAEKSFNSATEALGCRKLPAEKKTDSLLKASREDFMVKIGRRIPMRPILDGNIIPKKATFQSLEDPKDVVDLFPGIQHCKRVLIADCQMDGSALASRVAGRSDILPKTLEHCLSVVLDPIDRGLTPAIVAAYGLDTSATTNTATTIRPVLNFANDVLFALPSRAMARAWSASGCQAFLAHFNCPNPWDGPWKGEATHVLDIAFVLQNYKEKLSLGQQRAAERYAKDIVAFVNGADPWPSYQKGTNEASMVYDAPVVGNADMSHVALDTEPSTTGRRNVFPKLTGEKLLDKVMAAWEMFMKS